MYFSGLTHLKVYVVPFSPCFTREIHKLLRVLLYVENNYEANSLIESSNAIALMYFLIEGVRL
ncbi:hypothetical protein PGANDO_1443 [Porphyromonas gingivalis]|nr:hypothetical protein PGANDO_1443 [Porphyromonas gingivalis]